MRPMMVRRARNEKPRAGERRTFGDTASLAPARPLSILILGGTGFTGPHQVRHATAGFHRRSNKRAIAAGLTFRPVATTAVDTLAWGNAQDEKRRVLRAGLKPEREAELLAKLG